MSTPGNTNAVQHGGFSERQVVSRARARRRRFLRHIGLRAGDLDAIARAYLDTWARAAARVDLFDAAGVDHKHVMTAANTELRTLKALDERLRELGLVNGRTGGDPGAALRRHLEAKAARS